MECKCGKLSKEPGIMHVIALPWRFLGMEKENAYMYRWLSSITPASRSFGQDTYRFFRLVRPLNIFV